VNFTWWKRLARGARARLSFPLLTKELLETSARRRTYILRVIYAVALYAVFVLLLPRQTWSNIRQSSFELLGSGRQMFETLIILQYFGTVLFLPALMCGRITQEKERDSLVLLFLTELRPWSIVLQKYLGGLVLMLSFFLLGLPLAGVAYAFGGLESGEVVRYLLGLFVSCLQLGALSLFCSAWCRSTVGAFIGTYLFGAIFYAVPPLSILLLSAGDHRYSRSDAVEYCAGMFIPPAALNMSTTMGSGSRGSIDPAWPVYLLPSIA
jgi:ABC-type transport system involved in multi-copper enzyme maturation permease subunit